MAFSASLCTLFIHIDGVNSTFLILLCLVSGIGVGLVNGLFAAFTAFPPFIITLAMMSVVRGLAFIIMDGRPLYGLPSGLIFLGQGSFAGIPLPILIFILIAVGGHIILRYTAFGLHLCAYGDNPSAVKTSGVNVTRLKLTLYGLSGFTGAVAGLIFMGRLNAIDPSAGLTYELTAITAAIMGGAKLSGGRTSVMGAVTGTLIISFLQNGLNLMAIPSFYQYIATGIMLLLAVMSQPKERL